MTKRLHGKCCLVTGAGAGIGRASALAFSREGASVLAVDINSSALESLVEDDSTIEAAVLDVTQEDLVSEFVAGTNGIDVLFNCAGYVHAGTLLDTDDAVWKRSFQINVDAMFYLCRSVLPYMLQRKQGSIVNMSSVVSSIHGAANRLAYGASKGAVIGLTKAIAADYVSAGVRCNAICPGTVKTPSLADRVAEAGGDQEARWKEFTDRQPMGRLGEANEIAALALYLASDESSFTTGTINIIDGGWSI